MGKPVGNSDLKEEKEEERGGTMTGNPCLEIPAGMSWLQRSHSDSFVTNVEAVTVRAILTSEIRLLLLVER